MDDRFPSSSALHLADVDVFVVVGHLHPFDVAEVHRAHGPGAMQVLADDSLLFLDDFVARFANEMLLVVADVVVQDFDVYLFEVFSL